jgi:hypothetical protein
MKRAVSSGNLGVLLQTELMPTNVVTTEEHRLTGHRGAVLCLALHQDRFLISSSTDLTIKVQHLAFAHVWAAY